MLTPMMSQYLQIKEKYKDCIVFFRLGDFYEMFFEDAKIASKELELVLTGRECGLEEKAPMCGIPQVSVNSYISKLISKGFKVAICEQIEDASLAKGVVKREVIKVITPGTYFDENSNESETNIFLASIFYDEKTETFGVTFGDITTGEVYSTFLEDITLLFDEIVKFSPKEIIINDILDDKDIFNNQNDFLITVRELEFFKTSNTQNIIDKFKNLKETHLTSIIGFYNYIFETQKINLSNIKQIEFYDVYDYLFIDKNSKKNLELIVNNQDNTKKSTLYWVINKTNTSMGARLIKQWIEKPLISLPKITKRQDAIEELINNFDICSKLKSFLSNISDLDRIISKISNFSINPKEMLAFKNCIINLPEIKKILINFNSTLFKNIYDNFDVLDDLYNLVEKSISDEAVVSIKEGSIIKLGYNDEIDELKYLKKNAKECLLEIEKKEKEQTNIKFLKIGYNKIFGYYLEVSKSNYDLVPKDRYIRKQTLANSERYITEELKNLEEKILNAEEKLNDLEYKIYLNIRQTIEKNVVRIKNVSKNIALVDALLSLSTVAIENNYVRPIIIDDGSIEITESRHPVIEKLISRFDYVPNDIYLNNFEEQIHIITGPNMAGKSTFMRQVALIVIMTQIGSFVPAKYAKISLCDKIFTRIGASDDLVSGRSTFMVEMEEVAYILNNFTQNSLIILDEVGRGTSTYDGLSIAYAIVEYLSSVSKVRPKTLFATHYHELTQIEYTIPNVKNYSVSVKKIRDNLIFSRKVIKGAIDDSYGIEVAKLAGINHVVIDIANNMLKIFEKKIECKDIIQNQPISSLKQEQENEIQQILDDITSIDIDNITPLSSMEKLDDLIKKCKRLV